MDFAIPTYGKLFLKAVFSYDQTLIKREDPDGLD
jgi:hypothetical protein